MSKLIRVLVLAVLLSVMADSLYADVEDCAVLKGENQSNGLYGLCLAFWRADETQQQRFLDKYNAISDELGGPPMPGLQSDFNCPCWNHLTFVDVGLEDHDLFCINFGLFDVARFTYADGYIQLFGADNSSCSFVNDIGSRQAFDNKSENPLAPELAIQCRAEIQAYCLE